MLIEPYVKLNGRHPLYILQFDRKGAHTSPQTAARLLDELATGAYTDLYLFSHGWNNSFGDATRLYKRFFLLYLEIRSKHDPGGQNRRPVFVGLHWPSIILNLPWEGGPRFAASPESDDEEIDTFAHVRDIIADLLNPAHRKRFYALTEAQRLDEKEAAELAELLLPIYRGNALDTESREPASIVGDGLLAAWKAYPAITRCPPPTTAGMAGFRRVPHSLRPAPPPRRTFSIRAMLSGSPPCSP